MVQRNLNIILLVLLVISFVFGARYRTAYLDAKVQLISAHASYSKLLESYNKLSNNLELYKQQTNSLTLEVQHLTGGKCLDTPLNADILKLIKRAHE